MDAKNFETHRLSCKGILEVVKMLGTNFTFVQDSGEIEVSLPNPVYAPLLNLLQYPHIKFTNEGKLVFNVKGYLKNIPEGVVRIAGLNPSQVPLVLLNSSAIESKRMFYATKSLSDGTVEVTPYFFVPETPTPPTYHFLLDVSASMSIENSLNKLKFSVKELAKQLFQFQPNTKLSITTFSSGVHFQGAFEKTQMNSMDRVVDSLRTLGDTPLYEVTAQFLDTVASSDSHNNILLFTDGEESGSKSGSEEMINKIITGLTPESNIVARTKFYVFSYRTEQCRIIQDVARTFQSDVVNTSSPDFMAAQNDPELMKRWAAARELFTSRVVVENKSGAIEFNYAMSLDMSGQLASLKPRVCKPGEKISITVTDGNNKLVVESTTIVKPPVTRVFNAQLLAGLGIHAVNEASSVESNNSPTLDQNFL